MFCNWNNEKIKFMKKILLTLIFVFGLRAAYGQAEFLLPRASDYPATAKTGAQTSDFIPPNWKVLGETKGDLNGDKLADAALVVIVAIP